MNTFSFGSQGSVGKTTVFSKKAGYGLVAQQQIAGSTTAEQALHNGGWNCAPSFRERWQQTLTETAGGVYVNDSRSVLVFKTLVPRYGVYRLTLTVRAENGAIQDMSLFSGRRQVISRQVQIPAGTCWEKSWYAVSAPYIPAFSAKPDTEAALYVSVTGAHAGLSSLTVEPADVPVLWVAGDSTLTDQNALFPYYGARSCGGCAQAIARYFDGVAVCNYAHSGMTTNCFRDDGHWALIQQHARPGDVVLFQFGHNDQKRRNLAAFGGYSTNLRRYIREARELQLTPIIASPISRIPFEDRGAPRSLLAAHALAAEQVCTELSVPFINLHDETFDRWSACGTAASQYFMPGDSTHTNDYGADYIASLVAQAIRRLGVAPLASLCAPLPEPFAVPEHEVLPPPESATGSIFAIPIPYVDAGRGKTREIIERAFRAELLDPCVLHVHPHESLPRAQLLMVFFKAIRQGGVRPYLGAFDDISRYEWDAGYVQACITGNLLDMQALGSRFLPDEPVTAAFFALLCVRVLEKDVSRRLSLSAAVCLERAQSLSLLPAHCSGRRRLTRVDCYRGLVRLQELLQTASASLSADMEAHPVV